METRVEVKDGATLKTFIDVDFLDFFTSVGYRLYEACEMINKYPNIGESFTITFTVTVTK